MEKRKMNYLKWKRKIDIILGFGALIVCTPLCLLISIAIKLDSKGPVLFKQKRITKNKRYFYIYKFRTMYMQAPSDTPTHLLNDPDCYITKIGKLLRKTSLDELPQLFNILKGDMSVIGPRPALWNQKDLIAEREKYGVNEIMPGLTGWAQIHGRDELEIKEKAKLDGIYVKNIGLYMDIKCLFGTIVSVLKSDGIIEGGTGTIKNWR